MKISRKKRKLEYIREKNYYRLGGKCKSIFKISSQMMGDNDFIQSTIKRQTKETATNLDRKFKMKFALTNIETGINGDDFINDLTTFKFTLKVVR